MHRARLLLLIAAVVMLALPALQGDAKPLYCDYQCHPPYNGTYNTPCTCPPGSPEYGLITICGYYWSGICSGWAEASTAAQTEPSLAELEAAIFEDAPAPIEETAPAAAQ
jgi:hypothetical protein